MTGDVLGKIAAAVREMLAGMRGFRKQTNGMLSVAEGLLLYRLAAKLPKGSIIVEIGTLAGLSSGYILKGAKKNSSFLYSIDLFDEDVDGQAEQEREARRDFE